MKKIVILFMDIIYIINGLWYIAGSDLLLKGVVCFSDTYVLNSVSRNHIINYGTPIFFQGQYKALLHCLGLFPLATVELKSPTRGEY